jgi:hypothetical protein
MVRTPLIKVVIDRRSCIASSPEQIRGGLQRDLLVKILWSAYHYLGIGPIGTEVKSNCHLRKL